MLDQHCTTWKTFFQSLPDPRHARGRRYPWWVLLTMIMAALASGQTHPQAMRQWVEEHGDQLQARLWQRLPSGSTLRRALRSIDVLDLENRLRQWMAAQVERPVQTIQARALDGKTLRGTGQHGHPVHVVEEVLHGSGLVLWEQAVAAKSNEVPLVQYMLADRDLTGLLFTMDALHTQERTARLILDQGGHYLMIVKGNQRLLFQTLQAWFARPPWPDAQEERVRTCQVGHGRHEHRIVERRSTRSQLPLWPGWQQVVRRITHTWQKKTGAYRTQTTYAITSLPCEQCSVAALAAYWRGHWTIENKVHYVRDVTCQEDRCQVASGHAPQALAALRNGLLNQLRLAGATNIPAALRHLGAHVDRVLHFVGVGL
jgi:predicted transposase YbfD/YdcC